MKCGASAIIFLLSAATSSAFMTHAKRNHVQSGSLLEKKIGLWKMASTTKSSNVKMASDTIPAIESDHEVVTVDLDGGRDYPIYIGANFDEKQGIRYVDF